MEEDLTINQDLLLINYYIHKVDFRTTFTKTELNSKILEGCNAALYDMNTIDPKDLNKQDYQLEKLKEYSNIFGKMTIKNIIPDIVFPTIPEIPNNQNITFH
jgi:hypothetical protein